MRTNSRPVRAADLVAIGMVVAGAVLLFAFAARAAERDAPLHALVACLKQPETTGCYEMMTFESRTECRITMERVAVKATGARLSCQQIDRVRR